MTHTHVERWARFIIETVPLVEMGVSRAHARDQLRGLAARLYQHLLLLRVFPNSTAAAHWATEVSAWVGTARAALQLKLKPADVLNVLTDHGQAAGLRRYLAKVSPELRRRHEVEAAVTAHHLQVAVAAVNRLLADVVHAPTDAAAHDRLQRRLDNWLDAPDSYVNPRE
jgi:hypothetical protein